MPVGDRRLSVTIVGDASSGIGAFNAFATAVKATSGTVDAQAKKLVKDFEDLKKTAAEGQRIADQISKIGTLDQSAIGGALRNTIEAGLQGAAAPLATFQSALLGQLGGAENLLSGISTKTLAVGAGVAGLTVGIGVLGKTAFDTFSTFTGKVDDLQDVIGGTAESVSVLVNFSEQMGVPADTLGTAMARLSINIGKNRDEFQQLGIQIARNKDGSTDLVGTLANIAAAYTSTNDAVRQGEIRYAAFGKQGQEMINILEEGPEAIRKAGDAAKNGPVISDAQVAQMKAFHATTTEITQEFQRLAVEVAPLLIPVLEAGVKVTHQIAQAIQDTISVSAAGLSVILGVLAVLPDALGGGKFDDARDAVDRWRDSVDEAGKVSDDFRPPDDQLDQVTRSAYDAAQAVTTLSGKLREAQTAWQGVFDSQNTVVSTTDAYQQSLDDLDSLQSKAAADQAKYAKAVTDGAEKIAAAQKDVGDAQKDLADAQAGYAQAVEDAQARVADAVEQGRQRVEDAQERVADVEEQSARRVVDAQERVIDARKRADEQLKNSARRVDDARQALADALNDALRESNPFDAQRKREDAQKNLTRAEEDYAQDQADAAKSVQDAQDELAQTEQDTAKDRADAQKALRDAQVQAAKDRAKAEDDAARQIESAHQRVVDSQDKVSEAAGRVDKAMSDARQSQDEAAASARTTGQDMRDAAQKAQTLADNTFNVAFQMRQSGASMDDIQPKIDNAKTKVEELGTAGLLTAAQVDLIKQKLDAIPHQVDVQFVLHLSYEEFRQKLLEASQLIQDPQQRANVAAGIYESIPGGEIVPRFATGGVFRAPTGRNAGLAVLHDRELVLTPGQQGGLGGTTIIQVSTLATNERELGGVLERLRRQGYLGFN